MKKIFRPLFAVMAIALVASCTEQIDNENVPASGNLVQMTFSASMEGEATSKTTLASATGDVLWEASDAITVYFGTAAGQEFTIEYLSEDNTKAVFKGLGDVSADTYYAVYPHSVENSCSEGILAVNIPSEQTAVADGFATCANVSVASWQNAELSSGDNVIFRNICSLIAFEFATDADAAVTERVTFKVRKSADDAASAEYFGISGTVNVASDGQVVGEATQDEVVLQAPEDGFKKGVTYYVPVCPVGECEGLQITYETDESYTTEEFRYVTKNNDINFTLERNTVFNVGAVAFDFDTLGDEVTLTLDFSTRWPFNEDCVAWTSQVKTGEEYTHTHHYMYNDEQKTMDVVFVICNRAKGTEKLCYSYVQPVDGADGYLLTKNDIASTNNTSATISIPYVAGRYLKSININNQDNGGSYQRCGVAQGGFTSLGSPTSSEHLKGNKTFEFPVETIAPSIGTLSSGVRDYSIRVRDQKIRFTKITYVYSKTKPE